MHEQKVERRSHGLPPVEEHSPAATDPVNSSPAPDGTVIETATTSTSVGRAVFRELFQVIAPAVLLALVVHLFLAQATVVFGQSMEPNLSQNQRLIVDKVSYRFHPPQRDDIIVLDLPEMDEMLVKRIVGLPGEVVEVRDGIVYVNGDALPEPYEHDATPYDMEAITLGPLYYFVLGDNRGNSNDSRVFGPAHRDHILGRVWLRYWPVDQLKLF